MCIWLQSDLLRHNHHNSGLPVILYTVGNYIHLHIAAVAMLFMCASYYCASANHFVLSEDGHWFVELYKHDYPLGYTVVINFDHIIAKQFGVIVLKCRRYWFDRCPVSLSYDNWHIDKPYARVSSEHMCVYQITLELVEAIPGFISSQAQCKDFHKKGLRHWHRMS